MIESQPNPTKHRETTLSTTEIDDLSNNCNGSIPMTNIQQTQSQPQHQSRNQSQTKTNTLSAEDHIFLQSFKTQYENLESMNNKNAVQLFGLPLWRKTKNNDKHLSEKLTKSENLKRQAVLQKPHLRQQINIICSKKLPELEPDLEMGLGLERQKERARDMGLIPSELPGVDEDDWDFETLDGVNDKNKDKGGSFGVSGSGSGSVSTRFQRQYGGGACKVIEKITGVGWILLDALKPWFLLFLMVMAVLVTFKVMVLF
ncbi:unnamed protein product [Ambrosiozyma monospora]|uniref:Unnamed protein product n=1 Tax=Ambrosiozyma monospora TaxID=43982 RepID=A0ACB5SWU7_AMBMO|nr:unnamed protein product [Ambrosiozyma monospora]